MGTPRVDAAGAPSRCEVGSAVSRWATLGGNRWATLGRKGDSCVGPRRIEAPPLTTRQPPSGAPWQVVIGDAVP